MNGKSQFTTTCWGDILSAKGAVGEQARQAISELFGSYWYPIYAYIRRRGYNADLAEDLTQEFFARWIERDLLESVSPEKGRFRQFLLVTCSNFLANERERAYASKRGGGKFELSIDLRDAEGRYLCEPSHDLTAERLFERRWALTLLENALGRLRDEMERVGKKSLFDQIAPGLVGTGETQPYAGIASALGMTENAVKLAARRLRVRYRELLVEEVAGTVSSRDFIASELRDLFRSLAH